MLLQFKQGATEQVGVWHLNLNESSCEKRSLFMHVHGPWDNLARTTQNQARAFIACASPQLMHALMRHRRATLCLFLRAGSGYRWTRGDGSPVFAIKPERPSFSSVVSNFGDASVGGA